MQMNLKSLVHIVVCSLMAAALSLDEATREPRRLARRGAQSMVEYAIIAALVAVVALVAVKALGSSVASAFNDITHQVDSTKSAGATGP
jgi:Flp pilus assembly pilin Flp